MTEGLAFLRQQLSQHVSPLLLAEHGIDYEDAYLLVLGALPLVCNSQALPYM